MLQNPIHNRLLVSDLVRLEQDESGATDSKDGLSVNRKRKRVVGIDTLELSASRKQRQVNAVEFDAIVNAFAVELLWS